MERGASMLTTSGRASRVARRIASSECNVEIVAAGPRPRKQKPVDRYGLPARSRPTTRPMAERASRRDNPGEGLSEHLPGQGADHVADREVGEDDLELGRIVFEGARAESELSDTDRCLVPQDGEPTGEAFVDRELDPSVVEAQRTERGRRRLDEVPSKLDADLVILGVVADGRMDNPWVAAAVSEVLGREQRRDPPPDPGVIGPCGSRGPVFVPDPQFDDVLQHPSRGFDHPPLPGVTSPPSNNDPPTPFDVPEARVPPLAERSIGLEFYGSTAPGAPGRLKSSSDAFRVTEISSYPMPDPEGPYAILRVVSRDWEQHELAGAIARRLGLAPNAVQWAGTKDRRAVAERLLSYRGPVPDRELSLPRVDVIEAYRARDGLVLGHHYGNAFDLRVDALGIPPSEAVRAYRSVEAELRALGGFPNFFGPQRFGEVRPITHEVGRWVVRGDLARALDAYLIDRPPGGRPGTGDAARVAYGEHRDAARALREFPSEYRFERTLLEHLARGHPPQRAFRALS